MGWQRHTVRGFMAGAMKKAGFTVESFKPEGGERNYRLPKWPRPPSTGPPGTAAEGFSASGRDSWRVGPHVKPPPHERTCAKRARPVANPRLACSSRSSADQSASARHSPCKSGCPARIWPSMAAISRRQRAISRGLLVTFLGDLVERAPVASPLRRLIRSATSRSFRPEKLPGCLMIPIG
jgi:hypothetical protein